MEIYEATIEDVDGVACLFNLYRMFYKQSSDLDGAKAFIKERLEKKDSMIFIVKENGEYVGFTQLYPSLSSIGMKRILLLNDLFVLEKVRNKGIGQLLLNKCKQYAIETNVNTLTLSTAVENLSAQRLYVRNGFIRDDHFLHYDLKIE